MTHRRGFLATLLGLIGLGTVKASSKPVSGCLSHGVIGPIHVSAYHWTIDDKGRTFKISEGSLDFKECPERTKDKRELFPEVDAGFVRIRSDWMIDGKGNKVTWKCVDVEVVT